MGHHSSDKPLNAPIIEEFINLKKEQHHQLDARVKEKIASLEAELGPTGT